jgi:hypothetical protein
MAVHDRLNLGTGHDTESLSPAASPFTRRALHVRIQQEHARALFRQRHRGRDRQRRLSRAPLLMENATVRMPATHAALGHR